MVLPNISFSSIQHSKWRIRQTRPGGGKMFQRIFFPIATKERAGWHGKGKCGKCYFSGVHGSKSIFEQQSWERHRDDIIVRRRSFNNSFFSQWKLLLCLRVHVSPLYCHHSTIDIDSVSPTFICSLDVRPHFGNENKLFSLFDCSSLIELFDFRLFIGLGLLGCVCSVYWLQMDWNMRRK